MTLLSVNARSLTTPGYSQINILHRRKRSPVTFSKMPVPKFEVAGSKKKGRHARS